MLAVLCPTSRHHGVTTNVTTSGFRGPSETKRRMVRLSDAGWDRTTLPGHGRVDSSQRARGLQQGGGHRHGARRGGTRRLRPDGADQSSSARRRRFVCARRRLPASRRSTEPRVGRVGRRLDGGGAIADARVVAMRSLAASRFCSCDRCSEAVTVSTPSTSRFASRSSARARCTGPSAVVVERSRLSSARESAVLTDCPPGPEERLNRHRSSRSGTRTERLTRRGPTTGSVSPAERSNASWQAGLVRTRGRNHGKPWPFSTPGGPTSGFAWRRG